MMPFRTVFPARRLRRSAIFMAVTLALVGAAATASDKEVDQLRTELAEQQRMIQQLLENQQRQAVEIDALRQALSSRAEIVASTDATRLDESYEIEPEVDLEQEQALEDANTITVLPGDARFSVGGHIHRVMNLADDGRDTELYHVDSGNLPTLTYLKAALPVSEDLTLYGHIEYALQHNSANAVSQEQQNPGFATSARNFEMSLDSKRLGKLWFGRGLMASFVAVELDKSESWRYNLLSPGNTAGGLKFVDSRDASFSDVTVGSVFLDAEAFNRKDRIRYDSPTFAGLRLSGSAGSADATALALRWGGELAGLDIAAAVTTQNNPIEGRVSDRIDGGFALYHAGTGLSFTLAGTDQEYKQSFYQRFGRNDGDNSGYGLKLGWRRDWSGLGETRVTLDYFSSDDVLYKGDESRSTGLFLSQHIDSWNLEPYLGYRFFDYDPGPNADGLALEEIHVWLMGARMPLDLTIK